MDSSDLIILRHLLTVKNISATAKLMKVSQPAITMRLGKLRTMFKDELLVRDGNKMKLTAKALDMVNPIIRITDEMLSLIPDHDFDPHTTPTTITIQLTNELCETCIKSIIDEFLNYHLAHKIHITTLPTYAQAQDHPFKGTDAIIGTPTHIEGFCEEIYTQVINVLVYDRYFDECKKSISYEEYLLAPHIIFSPGSNNSMLLDFLGSPDPRNIRLQLSSLKAAIELLQDKYVITASTIIAQVFNKKYLPLPFALPETAFKLSYPKHLKHDKKNRWIRNVCHKVMREWLIKHCH